MVEGLGMFFIVILSVSLALFSPLVVPSHSLALSLSLSLSLSVSLFVSLCLSLASHNHSKRTLCMMQVNDNELSPRAPYPQPLCRQPSTVNFSLNAYTATLSTGKP